MKIEIDGVDRQLLLRLLGVYIKEQDGKGNAPIQNCYGLPTALKLFERLQPQGLPIDLDVGDFIESMESGQQFEYVAGDTDAPDSWVLLLPAMLPNGDPDQDDFNGATPSYVRDARLPLAITVEEAIFTPFPWRVNPATLRNQEVLNQN